MNTRLLRSLVAIWISLFWFYPYSPAVTTGAWDSNLQRQALASPLPALNEPFTDLDAWSGFIQTVRSVLNLSIDHVGEWIVVDTYDDTPDLFLSDDQCEDVFGYCSLRAAIQSANYWPGEQTILLEDATYTLTRAGAQENAAVNGDLDITGVLTITASYPDSALIDANYLDRGLHIQAGAVVLLQNLSITHGKPPSTITDEAKYWERFGGGIYNSGSLTMENVGLSHNTTGNVDWTWLDGAYGGGIYSEGPLTMTLSTISYNNTSNGYSGWTQANNGGSGAGLYQKTAPAIITTSTFAYNQTGDGGNGQAGVVSYGGSGGHGAGLYASEVSSLMIDNSVFQFNVTGDGGDGYSTGKSGVGGNGAGIMVSGGGHLEIGGGTLISDNITGKGGDSCTDTSSMNFFCSGGSGSGLYIYSHPDAELSGVTISRNQVGSAGGLYAPGGNGGGIYCSASDLHILYSDVLENQAGHASDGLTYGNTGGHGGGLYADNCVMTIWRTLISGNHAGNGSYGPTASGSGGSGGGVYVKGSASLGFDEVGVMDNYAGNGPTAGGGAGGYGGGLYLATPTLINQAFITDNHAGSTFIKGSGGDGGGIYTGYSLGLYNVTLSGNVAGSGQYPGDFGGYYNSGTLVLHNATVTLNQAPGSWGAGYAGDLIVRNSIIANNTATGSNDDCSTINSQGYNLVRDVSDCTIMGDTATVITNQDPGLAPLTESTLHYFTHPLLSTSPAIDAGNPNPPTGVGLACMPIDGRMMPRSDFRCDIGAHEAEHGAFTTLTRDLFPLQAVSFGPLLASVTLQSEPAITVEMENSVTLQQSAAYLEGALPTYWRISQVEPKSIFSTSTEADGLLFDVTFCYSDEELGDTDENLLKLAFWDGLTWNFPDGILSADTNCLTHIGATQLGIWTIVAPEAGEHQIYIPIICKPGSG